MDEFYFIKNFSLTISVIVVGIAIKIYLKRVGINDLNKILGVGIFWLKFLANTLIILGIFGLITLLITFCLYLSI